MSKKIKTHKKSLALILTLTLLIGGVIRGTVAWLMDTTDTVTNTFTVGNIDIELKEYDFEDGSTTELGTTEITTNADDYKILPGTEQPKNPFVRVLANTEKCYLFLQVQEKNNSIVEGAATQYITYSVDASVWDPLMNGDTQVSVNGVPVWYREHDVINTSAVTHNVLTDMTVSYSEDLTKEDIEKLYTKDEDGNIIAIDGSKKPELIFKAFAVQKEAASNALEAWNKIAEGEKLGYVASIN